MSCSRASRPSRTGPSPSAATSTMALRRWTIASSCAERLRAASPARWRALGVGARELLDLDELGDEFVERALIQVEFALQGAERDAPVLAKILLRSANRVEEAHAACSWQ